MTQDLKHPGAGSYRKSGQRQPSPPRLLASLFAVGLALLLSLTSCFSPAEPVGGATTPVASTAGPESATATPEDTTVAPESTLSAETPVTFQGVGPITLDTSAEELIGLGLIKEGDECGHDPVGVAKDLGIYIEASPEGDIDAVVISETSPLRTEAGAELGMDFGTLRELYGQAMTDEIKEGNGGPYPVTVIRDGSREMVFVGGWEGEDTVPQRVDDSATVGQITVREASPDMFAGGGC